MTHPLGPLSIQTARVLADVETLRRDYEPILAEAEPEIRQLLADAAAALAGVVSRTLVPQNGAPAE